MNQNPPMRQTGPERLLWTQEWTDRHQGTWGKEEGAAGVAAPDEWRLRLGSGGQHLPAEHTHTGQRGGDWPHTFGRGQGVSI